MEIKNISSGAKWE